MTERTSMESERAELVAIADQIDVYVKYGTDTIFEHDDAQKVACALRRLASQDQKPVAWQLRVKDGSYCRIIPDGELEEWKNNWANHLASGHAEIIPLGPIVSPPPAAAGSNASVDDYRNAIDEALVVRYLGVAKGNAKSELDQIISWEVDANLDPAVSSRAQALIDQGRNASAGVRLREALDIAHGAMIELRDRLHAEPSVQGREWIWLGMRLNDAIRRAEALSQHSHASDCDKQGPVPSGYGEYTPITVGGSTSDRPADVTVDELHAFILKHSDEWEDEGVAARALLDAYGMWRK